MSRSGLFGDSVAFLESEGRMRVRRVLPGCWEASCRRCAFLTDTGLVAQVGSWDRAMQRADEHVAEVHR